jgi:nitrite reductase (NADH) large subunit
MSYLKNVVVNDSLGMGEQWEQEMQLLVDSYACEWKEVVNDPELRKRFVHFVNAPRKKDPKLEFDTLRGQVKAQEW